MESKFISDENLEKLIKGLQDYKDEGVVDPWILRDGTIIEPLDVLKELRELRLIVDVKGMVANDKTHE